MKEVDPLSDYQEAPFDWGVNYDTEEGKAKIEARQAVYWCLAPGVQPPDYDLEILNALEYARIPSNARMLDIGSSKPWFHKLCKMTGIGGEWVSIDPWPKQFGGLPYLEPQGSKADYEALLQDGNEDKLVAFFKRIGGATSEDFEDITLISASADFIPIPNGSIDVATSIFSGYHAFQNREALHEIKRKLRVASGTGRTAVRAGIHADATSGNENKEISIAKEATIAKLLSVILNEEILPPPPLQAGFTSEDTLEVFPSLYKYVYVKHVKQEIIYNGAKEIILNALKTYRDSFTPKYGVLPSKFRDESFNERAVISKKIFDRAVDVVVGGQIDDAEEAGELITDKVRRTIIFGSDELIKLPKGKDGYKQIAP